MTEHERLVPRIVLREDDIAEIYRDFPVRDVKILVAEQDWHPFLQIAHLGMEIPVYVEGKSVLFITGILVSADHSDQSITVVI